MEIRKLSMEKVWNLFRPKGLAMNLSWPDLKNKQHMCFEVFEVF